MELNAQVRLEDDTYWAEVQELPGCFASGDTLDELFDSLREAVALYLADKEGSSSMSGSLRLTAAVLTDKPSVPA